MREIHLPHLEKVQVAEVDEAEVLALWQKYKAGGNIESRNELVEHYLPLVKRIADRLSYSLVSRVSAEDLYSSGLLGLLDAVNKYAPSRKVRFETFSLQRIRGAMIDDLRSQDWVPRQARDSRQKYYKNFQALYRDLGRFPSDEEMQEKMAMNDREFHRLCLEANVLSMIPVQEMGRGKLEDDHGGDAWMVDPRSGEVARSSEKKEFLEKLIEKLPEKKKSVLLMYYDEEMNLKEISSVLGVTEGRVSQILSSLLCQLREQCRSDLDWLSKS